MSNKNVTLNLQGKLDTSSMEASIKQFEKIVSGLNLTSIAKQQFTDLFARLNKEMKNFQNQITTGLHSTGDATRLTKNFEKIRGLVDDVGGKIQGLGLKHVELMPNEKERLEKLQDAVKELKKNLDLLKPKSMASLIGSGENTKSVQSMINVVKSGHQDINKAIKEETQSLEAQANTLRQQNAILAERRKLTTPEERQENIDNITAMPDFQKHGNSTISAKGLQALQGIGIDTNNITRVSQAMKAMSEYVRLAGKDIDLLTGQMKSNQGQINSTTNAIGTLANPDKIALIKELQAAFASESPEKMKTALASIEAEISRISGSQIADLADAQTKAAENTKTHKTAVEGLRSSVEGATNEYGKMTKAQETAFQIQSRINTMLGLVGSYQLLRRAIRSAITTIKDLDKAMTDIAVVTEMTVSDVWNTIDAYNELASAMGATITGAYEVSKLYYQQGLSQNEVMSVSTETMKMARIAGMDYATATDYMTASIRGFNLEMKDAVLVNDTLSNLAAKSAADTEEISIALTKTASIAHNAGMEIQNTAALLTQMIETTREAPENLGTAMKTIIARFQELKKDPSEMELIDGEMVDANKVETALRSAQIALRNAKGEFRDLDDVFLELSQKWDGLDKNTQRYIATTAAGARQQSRFIAMVSNYSRTMDLVGFATNSAGASQEQFNKTLDSLESKLNQLSNAWQTFTMGIMNSSLVKFLVDFATELLNFINNLTSALGSIGQPIANILLFFGAIKGAQVILTKLVGTLISATAAQAGFTAATNADTAAKAANTKGVLANISAKIRDILHSRIARIQTSKKIVMDALETKGLWAKAAAMWATYWPLLAIVAIAGAVFLLFKLLTNNTIEKQMERAAEATKRAKEAAEDAKSSYEALLSDKDSYDESQKALKELIKGTNDWRDALISANNQVLELLKAYPELAKYMERINGQLIISDEGWSKFIESERQRVATLTGVSVGLEVVEKNLAKTFAKKQYENNKSQLSTYDYQLQILEGQINLTDLRDSLDTQIALGDRTEAAAEEVYNNAIKLSNALVDASEHISEASMEHLRNFFIDNDELIIDTPQATEAFLQEFLSTLGLKEADAVIENFDGKLDSIEDLNSSLQLLAYNMYDDAIVAKSMTDSIERLDIETQALVDGMISNLAVNDKVVAASKHLDQITTALSSHDNFQSIYNKTLQDINRLDNADREEFAKLMGYGYKGDNQNNFYNEDGSKRDDINDELIKTTLANARAMSELEKQARELAIVFPKVINAIEKELGINDSKVGEAASALFTAAFSPSGIDSLSLSNIQQAGKTDINALASALSTDDLSALGFVGETALEDFTAYIEKSKQNANDAYNSLFDGVYSGIKEAILDFGQNLSIDTVKLLAEKFKLASVSGYGTGLANTINDFVTASATNDEEKTAMLATFAAIDWNNVDSIKTLPQTFKDLGIYVDNVSMQHVIDEMIRVNKAAINVDLTKLTQQIKDINELQKNIREREAHDRTFSEEDYAKLINADSSLSSEFVRGDSGWQYIGSSFDDLSDALRSLELAILEENKKELEKTISKGEQNSAALEQMKTSGLVSIVSGGQTLQAEDFYSGNVKEGPALAAMLEAFMREGADITQQQIDEAEHTGNLTHLYNGLMGSIDNLATNVTLLGQYEAEIGSLAYMEKDGSEIQSIAQGGRTIDDGQVVATSIETQNAQNAILALASEAAVAQDIVDSYRAALASANVEQINIAESAMIAATAEKKAQKVVTKGVKEYEEFLDVLEDSNKESQDYIDALKQLHDSWELTEDSVSKASDELADSQETWSSLPELLAAVAEGNIDALRQLAMAQAVEIEVTADGSGAIAVINSLNDAGYVAATDIGNNMSAAMALVADGTLIPEYGYVLDPGGSGQMVPALTGFRLNTDVANGLGKARKTGGGGGGGGGKKYEMDADRYFNPTRRIEKVQQQIDNLQSKRENLTGGDYIKSLTKEFNLLTDIVKRNKELLDLQKARLAEVQQELLKKYSKYTYLDENGTLQTNYELVMKIKDEKVGDALSELLDEWTELSKAVADYTNKVADAERKQRDIWEEMRDSIIEVEDQIRAALIERDQAIIDSQQERLDAQIEADNKYLEALQKNIEKQRQLREDSNREEEQDKLKRRIALLSRDTSGKNAAELTQLQEQLAASQQEEYDAQVDRMVEAQTTAMEQAHEDAQKQIDILSNIFTLKEEEGLYNDEIRAIMAGGPDSILETLQGTQEYQAMSEMEKAGARQEWEDAIGKALESGKFYNDIMAGFKALAKALGATIETTPSPSSTSAPAPAKDTVYTVKKGDTLSAIGKQFGVSWRRLAEYNNIKNANKIKIGQKIKIPAFSTGGLVTDVTPAILHGSKSKPEAVLNPRQTESFFKFIDWLDSKTANTLTSLGSLFKGNEGINKTEGNLVHITVGDINVDVGSISGNTDAQNVGEIIREEILNIARLSGNVTISKQLI